MTDVSDESPPGAAALIELMERAASGDHAAFAVLYAVFHPLVLTITSALVRNPTLGEDVAQDVLWEVWRRADRFDARRGSVHGWVLAIARSRAIDRVRTTEAARHRDHLFGAGQGSRDTDRVTEQVLDNWDRTQIRQALTRLTPLQQEAIRLCFVDDHTYTQASDLLGVSLPAFKSRIRSALLRLGQLLEPAASDSWSAPPG